MVILTTGVSGGALRHSDRRLVGGLHHGGDAPAQAFVHGLQHGADVETSRAVHWEAVGGGLDLRHQQKGTAICTDSRHNVDAVPLFGMSCIRVP